MIQRFKLAWFYVRSWPHTAFERDEWTADDQRTVEHFFNHGAGKRLMHRLKSHAVNLAIDAASTGTQHACGIANGAAMQISAIESHFPPAQSVSEQSETADNQTDGNYLDFNRLNLA